MFFVGTGFEFISCVTKCNIKFSTYQSDGSIHYRIDKDVCFDIMVAFNSLIMKDDHQGTNPDRV